MGVVHLNRSILVCHVVMMIASRVNDPSLNQERERGERNHTGDSSLPGVTLERGRR